jgi:tetratricopeptide (TPR) repeat protein
MRIDKDLRAQAGPRLWIWSLAILLGGLGCQSTGSGHLAPVETRDVNGFSITEATSVTGGIRADFDEANRAIDAADFERAAELLEGVTRAAPEMAGGHINLAIVYQRTDEFEEAEASLLRALEANPRHPVAHNELGIVYRRMGRFEEARKSYEAALSMHPEFHFARKNLAILCDLFLAEPICALEHYELYRAADPADEQAGIWIADLRNRFGIEEK